MAGLLNAEFFGIAIEHKALTRDERNVEQASRAVVPLAGDAFYERVASEHCVPHGRKIISVAHQLGAPLGEILRSLKRHFSSGAQRTGLALI